MPRVFLSYRRTDKDFLLEIYNTLRGRWGRQRVFWDSESIAVGDNWAQTLRREVSESDAVIVLIGPDWVTVKGEDGSRRLDSPNDWVRFEVATALETERPVLPILAPKVKAPRESELPANLKALTRLQALWMDDRRFLPRLVAALEPHLGEAAKESDDNPFRTERLTRLLKRQAQRLQTRAVDLVAARKLDQAEGEVSDGADVLMTLLDFAPDDVELGLQRAFLYKTMAQGYLRDEQRDKAERYLRLAAVVFEGVREGRADPESSAWEIAVSVHGLGNLHHEVGDLVRAMRAYRQALRIDPNLAYAWHDLFGVLWALQTQGVVDVAGLHEAKDGLARTRKDRRGHAQPSLGDDKMHDFEKRLEFIDGRIGDPNKRPTVEEWMLYAHGLLQQGLGERALGPIDEALAIDPRFPPAWSYKGAILVGLGLLDDGLEAIQHVLEMEPENAQALYNGACAYALMGEGEMSLDWLARAFRREPRYRLEARADPHLEAVRESSLGPRFQALLG